MWRKVREHKNVHNRGKGRKPLRYSGWDAVAVSHRRTKQRVTFYLLVTLRKCQKVKIKRCNNSFSMHSASSSYLDRKVFLSFLFSSSGSSEIIQLCRKAEGGLLNSSTLREVHHQEMSKQERENFVLDSKIAPAHFSFPFLVQWSTQIVTYRTQGKRSPG